MFTRLAYRIVKWPWSLRQARFMALTITEGLLRKVLHHGSNNKLAGVSGDLLHSDRFLRQPAGRKYVWFELQERVWFEEEEEPWSAGRADPAAGCSFPHPKPRRRPRVCGSPVSGVAPTTALLSSLLLCQRPTPLTGSHSRVVLKLVVSCASEAVRLMLCCAARLGSALHEVRVNTEAGVTGEPVSREPYPRGFVGGMVLVNH
ncbi:hypothetical protein E2C01_032964 [Portunus trituberculatus]|uniref:Uncharacterized protein n=1 Tax=Portunus trituberculatus TaxID=210409 RepID=A0A5B7F2N1_PORTR|nr:hypothetical protein [Portunus trituberculatus]